MQQKSAKKCTVENGLHKESKYTLSKKCPSVPEEVHSGKSLIGKASALTAAFSK